MKSVYPIFYLLLCMFLFSNLQAQQLEQSTTAVQAEKDNLRQKKWKKGGGLGMDFGQLFQLNPRIGQGENRVGVGGAASMFANYSSNRLAWDNQLSLNLAMQKLGSGVLPYGEGIKIPFQKSIDELRFNSKVSYQVSKASRLSYAADLSFLSQALKSYLGSDNKSYIKEINSPEFSTILVNKLFSPSTVTLGLGIDLKPRSNISLYFSPFTSKLIFIADSEIADLGVHGTQLVDPSNPNDYKNTDYQLGAMLKGIYHNRYLGNRIIHKSGIALFSNYLRDPQNIDIDWTNEFGLSIFKGLQLSLLVNLFYDHDVLVQQTDKTSVGGLEVDPFGNVVLRPSLSVTQQLLLKYVKVF